MAGKINPYDYEPEYSDDEDIGNVNVDKYEIRNSADVMTRLSDCSEGNSPLSYLDLQCWQATNRLVSVSVFGLGVFSMARRHAFVSLRHAAPPSAIIFFFRINTIII